MNIDKLNILVEEYKFISDDIKNEKERLNKINMKLQEVENKEGYNNIKVVMNRTLDCINDNLIELNYSLDVIKEKMKKEINEN